MGKADNSRLVSPRVNKGIPDFKKAFSLLLPVCKIPVKELMTQFESHSLPLADHCSQEGKDSVMAAPQCTHGREGASLKNRADWECPLVCSETPPAPPSPPPLSFQGPGVWQITSREAG